MNTARLPGDGVWRDVLGRAGREGRALHATLIDPATTPPTEAGKLAERMEHAGTDLFLVGGSTDVTGESVQATVDALHETSGRPVVLFPSDHRQLAGGLDAILFTVAVNSQRPACILEEQAKGSPAVLGSGLEAITTGYVIVEPGMTVGRVLDADLVPRDERGVERVERYAALASVLRWDALYLEAGSGAPEPVPAALVQVAAATSDVPVIVGGGIRSVDQARALVAAGARMLVTGTLAERGHHDAVADIVGAVSND